MIIGTKFITLNWRKPTIKNKELIESVHILNIMFFKNKNIVIGVTGGIAAYKSAEIIRLFK